MGLFVLRYLSTLMIFVLGLKAPGIMQNAEYFSLNDATRNFTPLVSVCFFSVTHAVTFTVLMYRFPMPKFTGLRTPNATTANSVVSLRGLRLKLRFKVRLIIKKKM